MRGYKVCSTKKEIYLLFSTGIEEVEEANNVAMVESPHDLKLAVLEPLVLQTLKHQKLSFNQPNKLSETNLIVHIKLLCCNKPEGLS